MRRSQILAVAVLALFVLATLPVQQATAQGSYSEKLRVYIAGSDALWFMSFSGINGSAKLNTIESSPGLTSYNVTAINSLGWRADFQVFGADGYKLLPVPFVPSQGLFLAIGSDSFADAESAASAFDSFLSAAFVSYVNGSSSFGFYSPVSFASLMPQTLLSLLPTAQGGFVNAISKSGFVTTSSPMVSLQAVKSGPTFQRTLTLGSIFPSALDSSGRPKILAYFGSTITLLRGSNKSDVVSSTIQVNFLDGIPRARPTEKANLTSNTDSFSGTYSVTLTGGKKLTAINATVLQQPLELLATRTISSGVLHTGDNVSVTLSLTDLSGTISAQNVTLKDDWWNSSGLSGQFTLFKGDKVSVHGSIGPGGTNTTVYRLHYVGTTAERIVIPGNTVSFAYSFNTFAFKGISRFNPVPLSLGTDDAVIYAIVRPTGGFGKAVGDSQILTVVATNVGTVPASTVVIAGQSVGGIADHGGTRSVNVSLSANAFAGINFTRRYSVSYQNQNLVNLNATTNVIGVVFSHSSMRLGLVSLVMSASIGQLPNGALNLTLSFTTSNRGSLAFRSFKANASLPSGLGCGTPKGKGITCSGGRLNLNYTAVVPQTSKTASLQFNLTSRVNYFLTPLVYQALSSTFNLTGRSNPLAVPTGFLATKAFTPSALFAGMTSKVLIVAANNGPFSVYNVTVGTSVDRFDTPSSSSVPSRTSPAIAPGGNLNFTYGVTSASRFGNQSSSAVATSLNFGGVGYAIRYIGPRVTVYQPLSATIVTTPTTPTEGKNFTLSVTLDNPSGVAVSDVRFALPIPSGVGVTNLHNANLSQGVLSMTFATFTANSTQKSTATVTAGSGITIPFNTATFTFSYAGQTAKGVLPTTGIAIGENVTTRYLLPIGLVLVALLVTAFYVRRKAAVSAPASPK